jgi:hypothetical protein
MRDLSGFRLNCLRPLPNDRTPDPKHPLPKLGKPHHVPYGVTLIGRLFEAGTLGRVGRALETKVAVGGERPAGF